MVSAMECVSHILRYSSAMIVITVGKMMLCLVVVIFSIIVHLGLNPNSGGRPPIDNRKMRIRVVKYYFKKQKLIKIKNGIRF